MKDYSLLVSRYFGFAGLWPTEIKMSRWNKRDWAETLLMFFFLTVAVLVLGAVGALAGELIFRLI